MNIDNIFFSMATSHKENNTSFYYVLESDWDKISTVIKKGITDLYTEIEELEKKTVFFGMLKNNIDEKSLYIKALQNKIADLKLKLRCEKTISKEACGSMLKYLNQYEGLKKDMKNHNYEESVLIRQHKYIGELESKLDTIYAKECDENQRLKEELKDIKERKPTYEQVVQWLTVEECKNKELEKELAELRDFKKDFRID